MDKVTARLTVFFEEPFWVGVCERSCGGQLDAARVVFGAEPKDYEVYAYFMENWNRLRFSPPVAQEALPERRISPKRMQREIRGQLSQTGTGTKAQQALKLLQEQGKQARQAARRQRAGEEREQQFQLRQQKKRQKRQGH